MITKTVAFLFMLLVVVGMFFVAGCDDDPNSNDKCKEDNQRCHNGCAMNALECHQNCDQAYDCEE